MSRNRLASLLWCIQKLRTPAQISLWLLHKKTTIFSDVPVFCYITLFSMFHLFSRNFWPFCRYFVFFSQNFAVIDILCFSLEISPHLYFFYFQTFFSSLFLDFLWKFHIFLILSLFCKVQPFLPFFSTFWPFCQNFYFFLWDFVFFLSSCFSFQNFDFFLTCRLYSQN